MLWKRLLTALWGIPLVLAAIWFGEPWFTILVAVWGALAAYEFFTLVKVKVTPLIITGILSVILLIGVRYPQLVDLAKPYMTLEQMLVTLLTLIAVFSLIRILIYHPLKDSFPAWAWTIAGIIYIGLLLGYAVSLRAIPLGKGWVFLALFGTFGSDTFAYFIGKLIGRHKASPRISPNKTWEGCFGGLVGGVAVALILTLPNLPADIRLPMVWWKAAIAGVVVSVFGQLGDLIESLLKRNLEAKDSGKLMAGHGGVLDRTDSILFAVTVVYYFATWWKA